MKDAVVSEKDKLVGCNSCGETIVLRTLSFQSGRTQYVKLEQDRRTHHILVCKPITDQPRCQFADKLCTRCGAPVTLIVNNYSSQVTVAERMEHSQTKRYNRHVCQSNASRPIDQLFTPVEEEAVTDSHANSPADSPSDSQPAVDDTEMQRRRAEVSEIARRLEEHDKLSSFHYENVEEFVSKWSSEDNWWLWEDTVRESMLNQLSKEQQHQQDALASFNSTPAIKAASGSSGRVDKQEVGRKMSEHVEQEWNKQIRKGQSWD